MQKVFITGGTGFLGSYLTRKLVKQGFQVRALKRKTSRMDLIEDVKDQIEWVEGDILDISVLEDAMQGIDKVYHGAAIVSFDPRDRKRMMEINVEGTANVVNIALDHGIKKLGYVSSIAAIGRSAESKILSEKSEWENGKNETNYARSKYFAEMEVWRGTAEGLPAVIINPTVIVGAGYWNETSCRLFKQIDDGLKFYTGGKVSLVDVRDVSDVLINLVESEIENERYILNAQTMPYLDFFTKIAQHLDKQPPTIKATQTMKEIVWRLSWLQSRLLESKPLITKETARMASGQYQYTTEKVETALNFKFRNIDTSISETGTCFKTSKANNKTYGVLPV